MVPIPRYQELLITTDGRIFDTVKEKWLNIHQDHNHSFKGPVAFYKQDGRCITLNILRMVYEAYNSKDMLKSEYTIDFIKGHEIRPDNLVKKRKFREKLNKPKQGQAEGYSCWMGGDSIYI